MDAQSSNGRRRKRKAAGSVLAIDSEGQALGLAIAGNEAALRQLRALEVAKLDAIEQVFMPLALAGSLPALKACLKVFDVRARLLGLFPGAAQPRVVVNVGTPRPPEAEVSLDFFLKRRPVEPAKGDPDRGVEGAEGEP